jgi:DNA-binding NtrC family response regulator
MENENSTEKLVLDVTNMPTLEVVEREYISMALKKANGSKAQAAKILGVSVKTIYNKLAQYAPPVAE